MEIKQQLIPKTDTTTRPGLSLDPEYITIHETDNEAAGADAQAHANLQQNGNSRTASWHYQVDSKKIIQSIPDNEVAWAAGDGRNGPGNRKSIHIEICVNAGDDYIQACRNAAWLVGYLLQKHKLGIDKVVQHNKWSGKNCPRHLRAHDRGMNWEQFISLCKVDKQGWIQENGAWYFYEAGKMLSGCWKKDENKWYFLNNDGKMASKQWVEDKVDWYYLTGDGSMAASKWVKYSDGWYYLAADGKMVKGWQYLEWNGKKNWYYFHVEDTTDRKAGQMAYNEMIPVHVGSDGIAKG